jgi:hypothetical protein
VDETIPDVDGLMNSALAQFSRTELTDLTRLLIKLTVALDSSDPQPAGEGKSAAHPAVPRQQRKEPA